MLAAPTNSTATSARATRPSHRRTTRADPLGFPKPVAEPGLAALVLGVGLNVDSDIWLQARLRAEAREVGPTNAVNLRLPAP